MSTARSLSILIAAVAVCAAAVAWLREESVEPGHVEPSAPQVAVGAADSTVPTASTRTSIAHVGRIGGTVVDVTGSPIAGATLALEAQGSGRTALTRSGPDGTFDVGGLEPGVWTARAAAPGRRPESADVLVERDGPGRVAFVLLRTRVLDVRIVDAEGAPLGPRLAAEGLDPAHAGHVQVEQDGLDPESIPASRLLATGRHEFVVAEATPFRVRLVVGDALLDEVQAEANQELVALRADVERIRSQAAWIALDFRGQDPGGTEVTLASRAEPRRRARLESSAGAPRIAVVPGTYAIDVAPPGRAWTRHELYVAPGATATLGGVALERECRVRGRVLDAEGRGLAATVRIRPAGGDWGPSRFERAERADVNGWFSARGLCAGRWEVTTEARPHVDWEATSAAGPRPEVPDPRTSAYVDLPMERDIELRGSLPELNARAGSPRASR